MLHIKMNRSVSLPVQLEDENGVVSAFELREMKQASRERYIDSVRSRVDGPADAEGKVNIRRLEGMHSDLLCLCLYDANGKLVTREFADSLPVSASEQIYAAAVQLNQLKVDSKQKAEEKN
jgi:hypothetical protein